MSYDQRLADAEREIARLELEIAAWRQASDLKAEMIGRLRALLVRYQAANYIPEDCDLYAETSRALEGK